MIAVYGAAGTPSWRTLADEWLRPGRAVVHRDPRAGRWSPPGGHPRGVVCCPVFLVAAAQRLTCRSFAL
jgi:hypothetical protein